MKCLVIDLEMCRVPRDFRCKNYRYANEIIQIGAVLLDDVRCTPLSRQFF